MVLPLLAAPFLAGAAGLFGAAMLKPGMDNRRDRIRGKYQEGLLSGIDRNDPGAVRDAMFGGGLLSGSEYLGDARGAYEANLQRATSLQQSRISAAPGHARVALQRELADREWANSYINPDSPNYEKMSPYDRARIEVQQEGNAIDREELQMRQTAMEAELELEARLAQQPQPFNAEQIGYVNAAQNAAYGLQTIDRAVDFVANSAQMGDETFQRAERKAIQDELQLNILPLLGQMANVGVISKEEAERLMGLIGSPEIFQRDVTVLKQLDNVRRKMVQYANQQAENLNLSQGNFGPRVQPFENRQLEPDMGNLPFTPAQDQSLSPRPGGAQSSRARRNR